LETLFAFAADGDMVAIARAPEDRFAMTGPHAAALLDAGGGGADNLVTRAATAFVAAFAVAGGHAINLDKQLPVASGIGGGSADAAATLRALARLHGVDLRDPRLDAIARLLGADVPACLAGETAFGTGRGDDLHRLDGAAGMPLLLVNPRVAVSTAAVFAAWDGVDRGPIPDGGLLDRAIAGRNDLEGPAIRIAPAIAAVLAMLRQAPGVRLARMSGSGATCFALFDDPVDLAAAATLARRAGHWCLESTLA
ncbi:MAG TPA: 4-(cytidine 5'-diphospho)-2-C-methyl-D-erythritol kinase, partial [Sphingomonas sp.]|nr:4-(cytidine 5'-diphospho)-2-C-methyl-D-erythritol kinase [Sphingomonas sp.]